MAEEPAAEIQLLRSQKAKLIEILSADADFVLQHADSRCLLSLHGYQQVKACRIPSEKVTDLLDHIIQRGPEAARGLLDLLNDQALQENFPMLRFTKDLQVNTLCSGRRLLSIVSNLIMKCCEISVVNINVFSIYKERKKHQIREKKLLIYKQPLHPKRSATMVGHTTLKVIPLKTL